MKVVDQRADIYAFGAVLFEMLSGKRLHRGETTTEVLASVIKEEPQWDTVPVEVRRLLRRCLENDPHKRLRHIGDVIALVDDVPSAPVAVERPVPRKWAWVAGPSVGCCYTMMHYGPWFPDPLCRELRWRLPIIARYPLRSPNFWSNDSTEKQTLNSYSQIPSRIPSGRADTLVRAGRLRPAQVGQGRLRSRERSRGPPYQRGSSAKFVIVFAEYLGGLPP